MHSNSERETAIDKESTFQSNTSEKKLGGTGTTLHDNKNRETRSKLV